MKKNGLKNNGLSNKKILIFGILLIFLAMALPVLKDEIGGIIFRQHVEKVEREGLSIINKQRTLVIGKDDFVTYKEYEEPVDANSKFYIFDEKRREKLCEYMKEGNFKLKSGTYVIGDSNSFEEIIKILDFEKIE